jgi:hypothetical protein
MMMLKLKTNQTGLNNVKNELNRQPILNTAFLWLFEVIELWLSVFKFEVFTTYPEDVPHI